MENEIEFIKRVNKVVKTAKIERSPYYEERYKSILIQLKESDWGIFQKILKKLRNAKK